MFYEPETPSDCDEEQPEAAHFKSSSYGDSKFQKDLIGRVYRFIGDV